MFIMHQCQRHILVFLGNYDLLFISLQAKKEKLGPGEDLEKSDFAGNVFYKGFNTISSQRDL